MNTLSLCILAFCTVGWISSASSLISGFREIYSSPEGREYLKDTPNWLVATVVSLVVFFVGPFFIPMFVWGKIQQSISAHRFKRMCRQYFPIVARRLHKSDLPSQVSRSFSRLEKSIEDCAFQVDGYFFLKEKPFRTYACTLVSQDGLIVAEICALDDGSGWYDDCAIELYSALENGSLVATNAILPDLDFTWLEPHGYYVQTVEMNEELDIQTLCNLHRSNIAQRSAREMSPAISIEQYESLKLVEYNYELFKHIQFLTKRLDEGPQQRPALPESDATERLLG